MNIKCFRNGRVAVMLTLLLCICGESAARSRYDVRIARTVDSIMSKMTVREKVAQLMVIDFSSRQGRKTKELQNRLVRKEKIGGLIPMNDRLVPAMERMNELNSLARIPLLITIDGEWGASMRYRGEIPPFPRQMQLGALSSDSLVYRMGYLVGKECRSLKMQVNFAPDVDINNNPANPAINTRSFGEDKEKVAAYGAAFMQGMKEAGVAGSAKHFPGHGDTDVDSHKGLPQLNFSRKRLDTLEMYPFRHLVSAGVDMVMVGHLNVPALDPSGTPSSISRTIVTDLLKGKMGFRGIVCTDALNMDGVAKESGLDKKDIPLAAYKAGADLLLMPEDVANAISVIEQAVKRREVSLAGLDEKVRKVLSLKARLGLFDRGYDPQVKLEGLVERMQVKENLDLTNQIAKNSMTVVFNDNSYGCGIPVQTGKKVAYLGYKNAELGREFAAAAIKYADIDTLILDDDATLADLKAARNRLRGHDLVITGFNATDPRPARNLGIVEEEMDFILEWAKHQPMIAVYLGSPYALGKMQGYGHFTAMVIGYSNTRANSFAAAQTVFGGIPAIGVLPVTADRYPVGTSVVIPERYREELFHYRGSDGDLRMQRPYVLGRFTPYLTVLPQVCELLSGRKIFLEEKLQDLLQLEAGHIDPHITVGEVVANALDGQHPYYLQLLALHFNPHVSIESNAEAVFEKLGMKSTKFVGKRISGSYHVPDLQTTGYDLAKYIFAIGNNGKYGGVQVFSPGAASILKNLSVYLKAEK